SQGDTAWSLFVVIGSLRQTLEARPRERGLWTAVSPDWADSRAGSLLDCRNCERAPAVLRQHDGVRRLSGRQERPAISVIQALGDSIAKRISVSHIRGRVVCGSRQFGDVDDAMRGAVADQLFRPKACCIQLGQQEIRTHCIDGIDLEAHVALSHLVWM